MSLPPVRIRAGWPKRALDHRLQAEVEIGRVDVVALEGRLVDLENVLDGIAPPPAEAAGDRPDLLDARIAPQGLFEVGRDLLQLPEIVAGEFDPRAVVGAGAHARGVILRVEAGDADVDAGELGRQLDELLFQRVGAVGPLDLRRETDDRLGVLGDDADVHLLVIVLGHDLLFEGANGLVGPGDVRPRGHADAHVEVLLRVPGVPAAERHLGPEPLVGPEEKGRDDEEDLDGVADEESEGLLEPRAPPLLGAGPFPLLDELGAKGRDQREGDEERGGHGRGDDDGQGEVVDLELALEEGEAEEDGHDRQRRRQDGDEDLFGALDGRFPRLHTPLPQAEDVLEDHDGVVDEHAEAQGQGPQSQHVERDLEGVDEVEGDDDGEGDRGQDEERRLDPQQDDVDHGEDDDRDQSGEDVEIVEVLADLRALVVDAFEGEARRQLALDVLELALDVGGDAEGVRPALLGDDQADRGLAVDAVDLPDVGVGHLDLGHVLDQNGVLARNRRRPSP